MAKLILGCGYLGLRVARCWQTAGEEVFALTRSPERAAQLAAGGIRPLVGDLARSTKLEFPPNVSTALFSVGFDRSAGQSIHDVYVEGLARVLATQPTTTRRVIYVSSTGVYGDVTGADVNEDSPCRPTREGGRACLAAEERLARSPFADRAIILRLAGLYGPGRIPRAADLLAGRPIDASRGGWLNLIHVAVGRIACRAAAHVRRLGWPAGIAGSVLCRARQVARRAAATIRGPAERLPRGAAGGER
jgi:nucleoside-diphosphate-sugar epimerase